MAHQVFVCHSSKDKAVADAACAALEAQGTACWIAPRDVLAGLEYGEAIVDAIAGCPILVLIFSAHANDSPQVRREIERAVSKGKTIVPFRIEDVMPARAMEYALSNTHWLDAMKPPVEQHLPELCRTVTTLIRRSAPPEPIVQPAEGAAAPAARPRVGRVGIALAGLAVVLMAVAAGLWIHHSRQQQWAREQAVPQINSLFDAKKRLAAAAVLATAQQYLPGDPELQQIAEKNSRKVSITSSPSGATVEIKDYVSPGDPWHPLGVTPLVKITVPNGYFRWRVSKAGTGEMVTAPPTASKMDFQLGAAQGWPAGMVQVPAQTWRDEAAFIGWVGPYKMPSYFVDRYEVTNRDYQAFVDSGGYEKQQFWTEDFIQGGRKLSWNEAMALFRDTSGRPGPSTWVAGHYAEGKENFPVSGVSWYEASAYAAWAGKSLPVMAQWMDVSRPALSNYITLSSNLASSALAPVGAYPGVGPYGTYDTGGNVSEWIANSFGDGQRMVMGGSWKSQEYEYYTPGYSSPFDRSDDKGFRCVKNLGPIPVEATAPLKRRSRDLSQYKPVPDGVFQAYKLFYDYPKLALHAISEGVVAETADWREEKVTYDTGYRGERMSAYLFLPKNVHPPYQTVLFFPSARIYFRPDNKGGRNLGDVDFFDYVVQSGRAVMYPIYQDTYERQVKYKLPGGDQDIQLTTDWYKDAARSLDYLATRPDIDSGKLAYLGVSMGAADGGILASLLQDRLKTAVFLDGGYFPEQPTAGADQADFVTRMKKPVLMVNGRYDFTFPVEAAQNPFFAMLGTPAADKRHVILDTPHDVTEQRTMLTKTVLDWLDHYMGRVQ